MIKQKIPLFILGFCVFKLTFSHPTVVQAINATDSHAPQKHITGDENLNANLMNLGVTGQFENNIYRKAAVANGMDPDAVSEVIQTRKPVVKVENDENGAKRTTTYSLQPDGSISRHVKTEYKPIWMSSSKPYLPTSITSTSSSSSSPENALPFKKESDWEWNPTNVPRFGGSPSPADEYPSWTPNWQVPTFTYGQRPAVEITPTQLPDTTHWRYPSTPVQSDVFNGIDTTNVGTVTKTLVDGDNKKITTVHTVGPTEWRTRTVTLPWSGFDSRITTTKRPEITQPNFKNVPTNLPSLDDFLKSQYATTMKSPTEPKEVSSSFPQRPVVESGSKPVTTIDINDLPIMEVLKIDNANRNHVETSPEIKTQTKTYTRTIQTNGVPQVSDLDPDMRNILEKAGINPNDVLTAKDGTVTKTRHEPDGKVITTTYRVRTVSPATNTFGADSTDWSHIVNNEKPQRPYLLDNEKPQGPFLLDNEKPQGPFLLDNEKPQGPFLIREQPSYNENHSATQFPTINSYNIPRRQDDDAFNENWNSVFSKKDPSILTNNKPNTNKNPIDEYLAKLNLTAATITGSNGEIIKTIVDDNGRVLTASFVLSTVRNDEKTTKDIAEKPPIK